jgi:hypothetical protein
LVCGATGAPNNASIEIPVEDYRFDRTTPGIVGQEVYCAPRDT